MAFGTGTSWGATAGRAARSGGGTGSSGGFSGLGGLSGGYSTNYSSGLDQYAAGHQLYPEQVQLGGSLNRQAAYMPFQSSYYDTRAQGQRDDYANSLASLGLQGRGNDIDRGAIARDLAYYDAMKAQAGAERANQGDINNNNLATDARGINSASTAAGNWFAPGRNDQISDAYKGWGTTNTGLDISYQRDILGLDRQKSEAQDRNSKLDLAAEQLGIDKSKLKSNLEQGLASLGYDRVTNMNSLLDALDSTDAKIKMNAQQIIMDAMGAGVEFSSGSFGDQYAGYNGGYNPYSPSRRSDYTDRGRTR